MTAPETNYEGATIIIGAPPPAGQDKNSIQAATRRLVKKVNATGAKTAGPQTVKYLITASNFGKDNTDMCYYISTMPASTFCTDIISSDAFMGNVVALRVDLRTIGSGLKREEQIAMINKEFQWACPRITPNKRESFASLAALGLESETLLTSAPLEHDARQWDAGLDKKGFVALYESADNPADGLLVVCCRTTPAAYDLQEKLRVEQPAYRTIILSKVYERILNLGARNARRLLYRAATAIGVHTFALDDKAAVPSNISDPIPAIPTRDALIKATAPYPLLAVPDISNMLDIFMPLFGNTQDSTLITEINYFNSVVPVTGKWIEGGNVINFCGTEASKGGIRLEPVVYEHVTAFVDSHIDGAQYPLPMTYNLITSF
jgi:hypothetical protein